MTTPSKTTLNTDIKPVVMIGEQMRISGHPSTVLADLFAATQAMLDVAGADHQAVIDQEGEAEKDYHENDCSACRVIREVEETLATAQATFLLPSSELRELMLAVLKDLDSYPKVYQASLGIWNYAPMIHCSYVGDHPGYQFGWRRLPDGTGEWEGIHFAGALCDQPHINGDICKTLGDSLFVAEALDDLMSKHVNRKTIFYGEVVDFLEAEHRYLSPKLVIERPESDSDIFVDFTLHGYRFSCSAEHGRWGFTVYNHTDENIWDETISVAEDETESHIVARELVKAARHILHKLP